MQNNDMNFIFKLIIYIKIKMDKMGKNYKHDVEVLHRKMIFDTQTIFKYNIVVLYHDFLS